MLAAFMLCAGLLSACEQKKVQKTAYELSASAIRKSTSRQRNKKTTET